MEAASLYSLAADLVLSLHVLFVAFVVFGLVAVLAGYWLSWGWVRNPIFRLFHLAAIGIVTLQAWFGVVCPLTTIEMALRSRAGGETYGGTFMSYWLQKLIYFSAPSWVFALCYTVFGLLVIFAWVFVRPRGFRGL